MNEYLIIIIHIMEIQKQQTKHRINKNWKMCFDICKIAMIILGSCIMCILFKEEIICNLSILLIGSIIPYIIIYQNLEKYYGDKLDNSYREEYTLLGFLKVRFVNRWFKNIVAGDNEFTENNFILCNKL